MTPTEKFRTNALALARMLRRGRHLRDGLSFAQVMRQIDRDALSNYAARQGAMVACRAGCSACCYQKVACHPAEVFFIADQLRRTLDGKERGKLVERLRAHMGRPVVGSSEQRGACPLLVDSRCSVYAVRPLKCVGEHSLRAEDCAVDDGGHASWLEQAELVDLTLGLVVAATRLLNLDPGPIELSQGLVIALTVPRAAARWQRGEPIFRDAAASWAKLSDEVEKHNRRRLPLLKETLTP